MLAGVPEFADEYGFGALRCATDNVNGDNVEYIAFPTGSRHVFCFAYYVTPPPTSGTIVVRKEVSSPAGADQTFTFEGNVSYTRGPPLRPDGEGRRAGVGDVLPRRDAARATRRGR